MSDFVKRSDLEFVAQLKHFASKLPDHKDVLGLTTDEINDANIASDYFNYVVEMQLAHIERSRNWTTYKDLLRSPGSGAPVVSNAPISLALPTAPVPAPMGVENWFRTIVKRVRGSKNYTDAIGQDLGIIATKSTKDLENMEPQLKAQLIAGQPMIFWKKQGMTAIEIYKESGDGNWKLLDIDMSPNYLDSSALPSSGSSITWKYKAIYRYHDQRVGSWSNEVSVVVSGAV